MARFYIKQGEIMSDEKDYVVLTLGGLKAIENPSEETLKVIALSEKESRTADEEAFLVLYWQRVQAQYQWEERDIQRDLWSQGMRPEKRR